MKILKFISPPVGVTLFAMVFSPAVLAQTGTDGTSWTSILPPLLAIGLALLLRQVIPALFLGVWLGAWMLNGWTLTGLGAGLLDTLQVHVLEALADTDHAAVILFSMMVGGMVGIISRNGGMQGIVIRIVAYAGNVRRAKTATVAMGLAIFFDDYANTLVVGNTMRPVTDRLRISREKLAYLVDSTAAPIACIALVTTWIGYEVGLINEAIAGIEGMSLNAYFVFLNSIAYSFYPLFALALVFAIVGWGRDFGPMHAAEIRARTTGRVAPPSGDAQMVGDDNRSIEAKTDIPYRALNAVLPVTCLVAGVIIGLFASGEGESLRAIIGSADPYKALMWGSLIGVVVAAVLSVAQRVLTLAETVSAWFAGVRSMLLAVIILILAWALSGITGELGTADFLVLALGEWLSPGLLPTLAFALAAATAFATGSSWGTMGILIPLLVPLSWALLGPGASPDDLPILYASVAAVLGGAVWGDHCSPISDTTILSSMATQCDHVEHVRTQLPYALYAGIAAIVFGTLPAGFGVPWWLCLTAGITAIIAGLLWFGRTVGKGDGFQGVSE